MSITTHTLLEQGKRCVLTQHRAFLNPKNALAVGLLHQMRGSAFRRAEILEELIWNSGKDAWERGLVIRGIGRSKPLRRVAEKLPKASPQGGAALWEQSAVQKSEEQQI